MLASMIPSISLWIVAGMLANAQWQELTRDGVAAFQRGHYLEASQRFEQAHQEAAGFAQNDARRWTSLNNLASAEQVLGHYETAEQHYRDLLALTAPSDVAYAKVLGNRASLARIRGRQGDAGKYAREAVSLLERAAPGSRELAHAYHTLGEVCRSGRDFERASEAFTAALGLVREPDALQAAILQSQASVATDQGRPEDAEPLQRRVVGILESAKMLSHPQLASARNNLAQILLALNRPEEALALQEAVLSAWEEQLGPAHPNVATAANNLAQMHKAAGRFETADPLYRKAIRIWEQALGPAHPDTAGGRKNLADLFAAQGKTRGAESLYRQALASFESSYGPRHPQTIQIVSALSQLYSGEGRLTEAARIQTRYERPPLSCARCSERPGSR